MRDRPILFSAPMVRALLDGRKTQTRRVLSTDKPNSLFNGKWADSYVLDPGNQSWRDQEVRFAVGDRLWVKETFTRGADEVGGEPWPIYKAEYDAPGDRSYTVFKPWSSSMYMPRRFSRITLTVTDVRVQRLQEVSNSDCLAEGIGPEEVDRRGMSDARLLFRELWDGINSGRGYGWEANPWVVASSFAVERRNIDEAQP